VFRGADGPADGEMVEVADKVLETHPERPFIVPQ
jgi:hypothetical protein